MPKGTPLTDDDKLRICELWEEGLSSREISRQTGLSQASVIRVKQEMYGKDVRSMDCIIAGDKKHGTLKATGPGHYIGTCLARNGKMKSKRFECKDSKEAKNAWEAWKDSISSGISYGAPLPDRPVTTIATPTTVDIPEEETMPITSDIIDDRFIYVLAVGTPKIAGYFRDPEEARKAMRDANRALDFAGINDISYSVITVEQYH